MRSLFILLILFYKVISINAQEQNIEQILKTRAFQRYYLWLFYINKDDSTHIKDLQSNKIFAYGKDRFKETTLLEQYLRDLYHGFGYMPIPDATVKKLSINIPPLPDWEIYAVDIGVSKNLDSLYYYNYYNQSYHGLAGRYTFLYNKKTKEIQNFSGKVNTYTDVKKYTLFKELIKTDDPESFYDYLNFYFASFELEHLKYRSKEADYYVFHAWSRRYDEHYEIKVNSIDPKQIIYRTINQSTKDKYDQESNKTHSRQWPLWGIDSLSVIKQCVLNEVMKNIYLYRIQKLRLMDTLKWGNTAYFVPEEPPYSYFDSVIPRYNEKLKLEIKRIDKRWDSFWLFQVYYPGYDSLYTDTSGYINTFYRKYLDLKPCYYIVAFDTMSMFYHVSGEYYLSRIIPLNFRTWRKFDSTFLYSIAWFRALAYGDFYMDSTRQFMYFRPTKDEEKEKLYEEGCDTSKYWFYKARLGNDVYYLNILKSNPEIVDIIHKNLVEENYKQALKYLKELEQKEKVEQNNK